MKKILGIFLSIVLLITTVGCAKVIHTETKTIEATIIEVDGTGVRIIGKMIRPADYDVLIRYKNTETWIDICSTEYTKYKDLIGTTVKANLITKYYDNSTTKAYLRLVE